MPCHTPYRDDAAQLLLFKIASCLAEGGGLGGFGVASFNSRTGVVTLTSGDVTTALGFTPLSQAIADDLYVNETGDSMTGLLDITTAATSLQVITSDAGVANAPITLEISHRTSGVPAAGFGNRLQFSADTNGAENQPQARIDTDWTVAADATRTSRMVLGTRTLGAIDTVLILGGGQTQVRDGLVGIPGLTFQSDTDTGLYRIGANVLGITVGGTRIVSVNSVGLGIGTDAATFKLELVGTASVVDRKIGINGTQVVYLPDQAAGAFLGSLFLGTGGTSLTHAAGMEGQFNTGAGISALLSNTTGANNSAIGYQALFSNTTGDNNSALGYTALFFNTTGANNSAFGYQSLLSNTTGATNAALGAASLFSNTTGSMNAAVGYASLFSNTTGSNGASVGYQSLLSNTSGGNNTAIGNQALFSNTTGGNNSAIGYQALFDLTTPATGQNTAVGYNTGRGITTGDNNTILGANVVGLAAGLSNNIIIADGAGNQRIQVGSTGVVTIPIALTLATAAPLSMASGANTRAGNATLVAGTVTVANTTVTANTLVIVTRKTSGGTIGFAVTYTVIAATSFTLTSDSALDTSTYSYILVENP